MAEIWGDGVDSQTGIVYTLPRIRQIVAAIYGCAAAIVMYERCKVVIDMASGDLAITVQQYPRAGERPRTGP